MKSRTVSIGGHAIPQSYRYNLKVSAIWGSSSSDVFVVGPEGTILHYEGTILHYDGSPSRMKKGASGLLGVWGSSSSDVFVVGDTGTILHYDGSVWEKMNIGTEVSIKGVWGSSFSDVFAVGSFGTILHYGYEPGVTGISIGSGNQGMTRDVVITGAHFTGTTAVSFDPGITVNSFAVDNSTRITTNISIAADAAVGDRDILVTTLAGTGTLAGGFTVEQAVPPPTLTGLDIGSGDQGMTLDIVITGTHFTGATAISFGSGISVNTFTIDGSTRIVTNISIAADATVGSRDILVTTLAGTGTLAGGFTVEQAVPPPTLTGLDIGSGEQGMTLDVVITGTHLTGTTAVSFGPGITVNSFTVDSSTRITTNISITADATVGSRDILVTTPAGTGTLAGGFIVEQAIPSPTVPVPAPAPAPAPATTPVPAPTPIPPGGGLSCGRSPGPQASGLGDLSLLLGIVLVCFGLIRFKRR